MVLLTFFSLLLFSSIIASLSKLYLSRDLLLVHSLPVSGGKIFLARWLESTVDSSWMVILFSLPVFLSYGIVYQAGPFFYATAGMALHPALPDRLRPQRACGRRCGRPSSGGKNQDGIRLLRSAADHRPDLRLPSHAAGEAGQSGDLRHPGPLPAGDGDAGLAASSHHLGSSTASMRRLRASRARPCSISPSPGAVRRRSSSS